MIFKKLNKNKKKGFNQMMSILMLGLISAGGGVGVSTFAQEQQAGLSQTASGAGLRESITIENVELIVNGPESNAVITIRNVGTVDTNIGAVYFDGSRISDAVIADPDMKPGEATEITISTGFSIISGSQHILKITTEGGGVSTSTITAIQH